jgi:AcrR family transcriptional regulator
MGRRKLIEGEVVLDAAMRAIKREGAAGMSLDAVATEAGICKASVLYDFKTKQGLIHALIRRQIALYEERLDEKREAAGSDSEIGAMIALAEDYPLSEEDRAAAINMCAALVQDTELRDIVRQSYRRRVKAVLDTSSRPHGALLAFFALEGILSFERLGLPEWKPGEREALLKEIGWLAEQEPARQEAA